MLIETTDWRGNTIYVVADKISVISQHRTDPEIALIFFGSAGDGDDWAINESVQSFRAKYEAAQLEESRNDVG